MFYDVKKGPFKIWGNIFNKSAKPFMKKRFSPMEEGRIEFLVTSLEPEEKSEQNGEVQILFTLIAYFLRPFKEKNL